MALTKGVGFMNVRAFTVERFGADAWSSLLANMPVKDREVLESVVPVGWYDLGLYARLIRSIDDRFGKGDLRICYVIGRFEAERDLTTIHQLFLKLLRPSIAIEQTGKYWSRFHDTGKWTIERNGDRELVGHLADWGVVDAGLCRELIGYMGRTLELLGGRDVTMDHPRCRTRGEPVCEFRSRWLLKKDAPARERAAMEAADGEARTPDLKKFD